MSGTPIVNYSALFDFRMDSASVTRLNATVDRIKRNIERKLGNIDIGGFRINRAALNRALRDVSANIIFPISNFRVDAVALRRAVQTAFDTGVTLRVNAVRRGGTGSSTDTGGTRSGAASRGRTSLERIANEGSRFLPAFATFAGLGRINQISQDLTSGKMSLETVTKGRGVDAYNWLKNSSNQTGIDYRETLPVFSNYLASSINKQGYDNSLTSFQDLSQYGATHGATNVSMQRAMLSLGQMWSKGKIMAEELNNQLAEATGFGGAKELFAQAYQESVGGKLTGQKAEAALIAAMKKGEVKSADVLPIVTRLMGQDAAGGIDAYSKSTRASQNRFKNAVSDTIEKFGQSGFDAQMARFFNNLTKWLTESDGLVRTLGESFGKLIDILEGLVNTGKMVFNFFYALSPQLTSALVVLLPLSKIIGTTAMVFGLLALVLEDLSFYVNGKDSVIGSFIEYMTTLVGFDFNGIAAGFAIVGIAIAAAFAPITAIALSIGALIVAYDYLNKLKKAETVTAPTNGAPEWSAINKFDNQAWAKKTDQAEGIMGKGMAWGDAFAASAMNGLGINKLTKPIMGATYADKSTNVALMRAVASGAISSEENDRYLAAMGVGMMTGDDVKFQVMQKSSKREGYEGIFKPSTVNINIDKVLGSPQELTDAVTTALTNYGNKTAPIPPTGNQ